MRAVRLMALGLIPLVGSAQAPPTEDSQLAGLVREALERNPALARAQSLVQAERERAPQASALPDPSLSLGIQNDGFKKLQIGQMESSYYQVMVTQGLPWPGKRGLRGEVARLGADALEAAQARTRLTLEADVRRAYVGLLVVRGQLRLLADQALFLAQAEAVARTRYEVGQGAQADLLRAQVERTRLEQTRLDLQRRERTQLAELNRLRALPPATPLATGAGLDTLAAPAPADPAGALADARTRSPELRAARLGVDQAGKAVQLARLERRPDFGVSAGIMPRGSFEPMWTAGVSISLPLWSRHKQDRAVAEQEQRRRASGAEAEALEQALAERVEARAAELEAALATVRLYQAGLLVQSESSFRAALAQYQVGRTPFLSALEALNGWIADQSGLLQAQAQVQAVAIAQREVNPGPTPGIGGAALGAAAMGAAPAMAAPAVSPRPGSAPAASESSSMQSM